MKDLCANKRMRQAGAVSARALPAYGLFVIVFCVLTAVTFIYLNRQQQKKITRQIEAIPAQKSAEVPKPKVTFAVAMAKVKQEEALAELRWTTHLLEKLSTEVVDFLKMGEILPATGSERQNLARQFFAQSAAAFPTPAELTNKLGEINSSVLQVKSAEGTAALPDPHLVSAGEKMGEWATTTSDAVIRARERLNELLVEAKMAATPAVGMELKAPEAIAAAERPAGKTEPVEMSAVLAETKAEAARILSETRAEAIRILLETRKEAEKILAETKEKLIAREPSENRLSSPPVTQIVSPPARETASLAFTPEASPAIVPPATEAQKSAIPLDARRARFQEMAADPKIQGRLAAFTTPGNMRLPGSFRVEKTPISLSQLKRFGALEQSVAGLGNLVEVASNPQDAVRPRWKVKKSRGSWHRNANEIEEIKAVQNFFIEFGPECVAAGLLVE